MINKQFDTFSVLIFSFEWTNGVAAVGGESLTVWKGSWPGELDKYVFSSGGATGCDVLMGFGSNISEKKPFRKNKES